MATESTLDLVLESLPGWSERQNYNLAVLLVPAAQAWTTRQRLLDCWSNTVDFDAEVIRHLTAGDWNGLLADEREGRHASLSAALSLVVEDLAGRIGARPLVVTNINLPVLADWDAVGQRLYLASRAGLVVLVVVGSVEARRICLHGRMSFLSEESVQVVVLGEEP